MRRGSSRRRELDAGRGAVLEDGLGDAEAGGELEEGVAEGGAGAALGLEEAEEAGVVEEAGRGPEARVVVLLERGGQLDGPELRAQCGGVETLFAQQGLELVLDFGVVLDGGGLGLRLAETSRQADGVADGLVRALAEEGRHGVGGVAQQHGAARVPRTAARVAVVDVGLVEAARPVKHVAQFVVEKACVFQELFGLVGERAAERRPGGTVSDVFGRRLLVVASANGQGVLLSRRAVSGRERVAAVAEPLVERGVIVGALRVVADGEEHLRA
mmetsp:Transcript_23743/g.73091  ORF Transcript_23743/g.73091 Transcript_23743/m.73091 type:complete len:272 (+) Transcript_23743:1789-2604(+)